MTLYTTLELVQAEIRAADAFTESTSPKSTTVSGWIEEADAYIDMLTSRTYKEATYTELIDYDGSGRIQVLHSPILTVTSVKYAPYAIGSSSYPGWVTKVAETDYTIHESKGEIEILTSNWDPTPGTKRIEIIYTAGYTNIPAYIRMLSTKLVAKRVLDTLMQQDLNEKQSGKSISVGSISIVKPAEFGINNYKQLKSDIDELKSTLTKGTGVYRYSNY